MRKMAAEMALYGAFPGAGGETLQAATKRGKRACMALQGQYPGRGCQSIQKPGQNAPVSLVVLFLWGILPDRFYNRGNKIEQS